MSNKRIEFQVFNTDITPIFLRQWLALAKKHSGECRRIFNWSVNFFVIPAAARYEMETLLLQHGIEFSFQDAKEPSEYGQDGSE